MVLLAGIGGALMFVAHFGAFVADSYTTNLRLPYWWAYVLLYPLAAIVAARRAWLPPITAAATVCALPALYFLALGVLGSNWRASSGAIGGVALAFVVAAVAASWAHRRGNRPTAT